MLKVNNICCRYGDVEVLHDFSFAVEHGKIACLMGRNGAGKTSFLKALMGSLKLTSGEIWWNNNHLDILPPHKIASMGVGIVPQGRRLFAEMSVAENIEIGLRIATRNETERKEIKQKLLDLFPLLANRTKQIAATLSGGEQQILALARAMASQPSLLLLDEPSEGLQPSMLKTIGDVILKLKNEGTTIILVEQRLDLVLPLADSVTFIENGYQKETISSKKINPKIFQKYIGI